MPSASPRSDGIAADSSAARTPLSAAAGRSAGCAGRHPSAPCGGYVHWCQSRTRPRGTKRASEPAMRRPRFAACRTVERLRLLLLPMASQLPQAVASSRFVLSAPGGVFNEESRFEARGNGRQLRPAPQVGTDRTRMRASCALRRGLDEERRKPVHTRVRPSGSGARRRQSLVPLFVRSVEEANVPVICRLSAAFAGATRFRAASGPPEREANFF